jgi:hypothetical protein
LFFCISKADGGKDYGTGISNYFGENWKLSLVLKAFVINDYADDEEDWNAFL